LLPMDDNTHVKSLLYALTLWARARKLRSPERMSGTLEAAHHDASQLVGIFRPGRRRPIIHGFA
jgi:hypothetical protein